MNSTTTRPYVLIDACAIIDICKIGWWERIIACTEMAVPSYVVEEAEYYVGADGWAELIDLEGAIEDGDLTVIASEQPVSEILGQVFTQPVVRWTDPGEAEALALIFSGQCEGYQFCSTDGAAIERLALMGKTESGISVESMLSECGFNLPGSADDKCREGFYQKHIQKGKQQRMRGDGFVIDPFD
ncbi:MAG: hypothetical protein ACLFWL_07920 [Candidatus Brocadiia bacterium]